MTPTEAQAVIYHESVDEDGLIVQLRAGNDPGRARVARLLDALQVLFEDLAGRPLLDRKLASALFGLAHFIEIITNTTCPSKSWTKEFLEHERFQICFAVESIFEDIWITSED